MKYEKTNFHLLLMNNHHTFLHSQNISVASKEAKSSQPFYHVDSCTVI